MKKTIKLIGLLFIACILSVITMLFISYITRNHYPQSCYNDNKEKFEEIVDEFDLLYEPGLVCAKYEHDTQEIVLNYSLDKEHYTKRVTNNRIGALISELKELYQKDSDFPVFSYISADYDEKGNVFIETRVKADSIKGGDGVNSHDVFCCDLIFVDESYEENNIVDKYELKSFSSDWYVYSYSTFSG